MRRRRTFTAEHKAEAVGVLRSSGETVTQGARDLDLTETAVRGWVRQAAVDSLRDPQGR
jgi:transposase